MSTTDKDLFEAIYDESREPLAARMRPRTLDEFVGQDHILGPGRLLRRAIQADRLSSVIFSGPPGTGKTTLARVIANTTKSSFLSLNAVLSGVKDVREAIEEAKKSRELYDRRTILFVDEVHRWNKAQQDALLPWVENGTFILIGATTENPFFEVNSALVSRSRVFQLKPLDDEDLRLVAKRALEDEERGYGRYRVVLEPEALDHLVEIADGDARTLLGALELAVETTPAKFPPPPGTEIRIDLQTAEESIQRRAVLYDKNGDYHYDTISAFIKSIRGSDPDAALYWMARMIAAGEDPHFLFRRMLISACEDVGLADPQALVVVEAAANAFDRIGMPEGQFHLTQAVLYLATCPKSNSALGFFDALGSVEKEGNRDVPNHLKDASRDKKGFGHGDGYLYPHAYRDHWVAQAYLPAEMRGRVFYTPSNQGYEARIRNEVLRKREAQLEAVLESSDEILTFSPGDAGKEEWLERITRERNTSLEAVRDRLFFMAAPARHHRVLVADSGSGLLLWEALRRVPEGGVWGVFPDSKARATISEYCSRLPEIERPFLVDGGLDAAEKAGLPGFEVVLGRNLLTRETDRAAVFGSAAKLLAEDGVLAFAETIPSLGTRLSEAAGVDGLPVKLADLIAEAEARLYGDAANPLVNWGLDELAAAAEKAGLSGVEVEVERFAETRFISEKNVEAWFGSPAAGRLEGVYGSLLAGKLDDAGIDALAAWCSSRLLRRTLSWKTAVAFVTGRKGPVR